MHRIYSLSHVCLFLWHSRNRLFLCLKSYFVDTRGGTDTDVEGEVEGWG